MGKKKNCKTVKENLAGNKNPDPNEDLPSSSTSTLTSVMDPQVVNNDQQIYMDDLPAEMLTQILKCVETENLFNLRLVSKKWSEISSGILHHRPDNQLYFGFLSDGFSTNDDRPLKEFLLCMRESKNCPFARFTLWTELLEKPEDLFQDEVWLQFLSDFSGSSHDQTNQNKTKLKCLELIWNDGHHKNSLKIMIEQLKDLLNKLPNLEEFGLEFDRDIEDSEIPLFPTTTSTEAIKFPQIKTIQICASFFSRFPGITRDLLTGAVNLKKIILFGLSYDYTTLTIDVYNLLRSLGKLELLHNAEIVLDENFLSEFKTTRHANSNPFQEFKLKEMGINDRFIDEHSRDWTDATNFLSNILDSNKDTLKSLSIRPCGFLHNSQTNHSVCFPEFKNLTDLVLGPADGSRCRHDMPQMPFFPPGIRSMDVFPAVNHLCLGIMKWAAAFPRDDFIPRLPRLRILDIEEEHVTEIAISKLALLCPNLKKLKISKRQEEPPELNLLDVGRSIWTEMKQLEALELNVNLNFCLNNSAAFDSCFTGISEENCKSLFKKTKARKTGRKRGFQAISPELTNERLREHPSILDMKDLRKLTINPYSGKKLLDKKEFSNKLTWISQEYAFKLMPQLKLNEED